MPVRPSSGETIDVYELRLGVLDCRLIATDGRL
jgi:hypothetical protein